MIPAWYPGSEGDHLDYDALAVLWDNYTLNNDVVNPQSNLTQRIQYAVEGVAPSRNLTVEWVAGASNDPTQHYRFWATFYEAEPKRFTYTYWDVSDSGRSGTAGAQWTEEIGQGPTPGSLGPRCWFTPPSSLCPRAETQLFR
jgi:hypothetical protein